MSAEEYFAHSLANFAIHQLAYENKFQSEGRQPRDIDWRPVRFAVRDVILFTVVTRLQMKDNIIEVDVFLTYDPEAIPGWSGTKFATIYILSQAYKSGSSMGIRFSRNVEGGRVPECILKMARWYGVSLKDEHVGKGVITPKEARSLYLALTEFSHEAMQRVMELSVANRVSPERVCYMVHHGTYTKEEMESLLLGTEFPEHILLGKVTPQEYLLYIDVVLRSRDIVLAGMLDRKLKLKEVVGADGNVIDLEYYERQISIDFDPRFFAKVYETLEETPVPWTGTGDLAVKAGELMVVLVRGRDWADFKFYFDQDLEALQAMKSAFAGMPTHFYMLVSRSVLDLEESESEDYIRRLLEVGVDLMVCPESVVLLDAEVIRRLRECETMRHDIGLGRDDEAITTLTIPLDFNATEIRLVAIPQDLRIGRQVLPKLTEQGLYDEEELLRGVNKHNVRHRYHLVLDRVQFLAHLALLSGQRFRTITLDPSVFPGLSELWSISPGKVRDMRLLPAFWMPGQASDYVVNLKTLGEGTQALQQIASFLQVAAGSNQVVIAVQNKHSRQTSQNLSQATVQSSQLAKAFAAQFVPDWINDYSNTPFDQVVVKHLWRAVQSARRGQPNGVNLDEVPHLIITKALHTMVYEDPAQVDNQKIAVNIVYADGSQARPFPLFCLTPREGPEIEELRTKKRIRMGMISWRHREMNSLIDQYWFRNIEVSGPGMTSAEVDEFCYQTTLTKLSDIYQLNIPVCLDFYQTGFQAPLVGFLRAVVEFLKQGQGRLPMLEIVPHFYDKRLKDGQEYEKGQPWH